MTAITGEIFWMEGFGPYSLGSISGVLENGRKWTNLSGSTASIIAGRHPGGRALRLGGSSRIESHVVPSYWGLRAGAAVRTDLSGTAPRGCPLAFATDGNAAHRLSLVITDAGFLQLRRGSPTGDILATTDASEISSMAWYYLELFAAFASNGGNQRAIVWLNGVEKLNYEANGGGAVFSAGSAITGMRMRGSDAVATFVMDVTDMFMERFEDPDASGYTPPLPRGDTRIETLFPNAITEGASDWTPSAGTLAEAIDGAAPDDDATYAETAAVSARLMADTADTLSDAPTDIHAVGVNVRASESGASSRTVTPRLKADSAEETKGGPEAITTQIQTFFGVWERTPNDNPWTVPLVHSAEFGADTAE